MGERVADGRFGAEMESRDQNPHPENRRDAAPHQTSAAPGISRGIGIVSSVPGFPPPRKLWNRG